MNTDKLLQHIKKLYRWIEKKEFPDEPESQALAFVKSIYMQQEKARAMRVHEAARLPDITERYIAFKVSHKDGEHLRYRSEIDSEYWLDPHETVLVLPSNFKGTGV